MENRWYIHKDGQDLGPLTATEIRDGLRDGSFDPFDLVSRDGSPMRRELVEVDEIFVNSKVVYGDPFPPASAPAADGIEDELRGGFIPAHAESTKVSAGEKLLGNGRLALADGSTGSSAPESFHPAHAGGSGRYQAARPEQRRPRKRDPKSYHLIDGRGRVLGPLSAREVQALFFRGVLDKSVVVTKNGTEARVPVAKFVAVYSAQSGGGPQGAHPAMQGGAPRPKRAPFFRPGPMQAPNLTGLAYLLGALLVVLAGMIAWENGGARLFGKAVRTVQAIDLTPPERERAPKARPQKKPAKPKKVVPPKKAKAREEVRAPDPRAVRKAKIERQRAAEARVRAEEGRKRAERERRALDQRRRIEAERRARERAELVRRQRAALDRRVALERQRARTPPPQRAPQPAPRPAPQPQPRPQPKPVASGPTVASLVDGQTVSRLGPMSFSRAQVEACEAACTVTFTGAGGSVQGKFFKGVWGPVLLGKGGGVYLTGLVRKQGGGTTLILSGVQ